MKIFVKAKPGAKENKIKKIDESHFEVSVNQPPKENKANFAVIELLADYFEVPFSGIRIISGATSKNKILEIAKLK